MRFRAWNANSSNSTLQIWICAFWIGLTSLNLHRDLNRHHHSEFTFHVMCLTVFVVALGFHFYFRFCGSITLDNDSLTIRQSFKPLTISYASVVDAQYAVTPNGKALPHVVELEIARLAQNAYPRDYRRMYLSEPDAFLKAIRAHLTRQS